MSYPAIEEILREFDRIELAIVQAPGRHSLVEFGLEPSANGGFDPTADYRGPFCEEAARMLSAPHGFPDAKRYEWITDPKHYRNAFEVWCQGAVVNCLILMWEQFGDRCDKTVIVRNEHTGSYHMEVHPTENAYFICISYQFSNLFTSYSLLNKCICEIGERAQKFACFTATDTIGGHAIERAIRSKWSEICPHLDDFWAVLGKTSNYEASVVSLSGHVLAAIKQFASSQRFAHLRNPKKLIKQGQFYLPCSAMWTMFTDHALNFALAHELMHIKNGHVRGRGGRDKSDEVEADLDAMELSANAAISESERRGHDATLSSVIIGPGVFFSLSRMFAHFERFENNPAPDRPVEVSTETDNAEEMAILQRSTLVGDFIYTNDIVTHARGAANYWGIVGELSLLEIALRRRRLELLGASLPEVEPAIEILSISIKQAESEARSEASKDEKRSWIRRIFGLNLS